MYVGDTAVDAVDVLTGRAAGVPTAGFTYGLSDEAEMRTAEPDYILHSFAEMRSFLHDRSSESIAVRTLPAFDVHRGLLEHALRGKTARLDCRAGHSGEQRPQPSVAFSDQTSWCRVSTCGLVQQPRGRTHGTRNRTV